MLDNEIIKALERCPQHHECCYCNSVEECGNKRVLTASTLDLINRQNAEIEKLKAMADAELDTIHNLGDDYARVLEEMQKVVEKAKVDAVKEFVDKLCGEMWGWLGALVSDNTKLSIHSKIHNLADKLTEKGGGDI